MLYSRDGLHLPVFSLVNSGNGSTMWWDSDPLQPNRDKYQLFLFVFVRGMSRSGLTIDRAGFMVVSRQRIHPIKALVRSFVPTHDAAVFLNTANTLRF